MHDHQALIESAISAAAGARSAGTRPILLLGQNAPAPIPADAPAFSPKTETGRRAMRLWDLDRGTLSALVRVNALPADPITLKAPAEVGLARLSAVRRALGDGPTAIIAAGTWAADIAARHLGLRHRPAWNRPVATAGGRLLAVPHPSGRCFAYNCSRFRAETASVMAEFIREARKAA